MTQANIVTTQDGTFAQTDDTDESPPKRRVLPTAQKRHRIRSSSVSLSGTGRNERGEKMGVLKTVQLHTRSRHVFAPVETLASAKERLLAEAVDLGDVVARPLLVRRNSTSAPLSPLLDESIPVPLPTPPPELDQAPEELPQVTFAPPVIEATSTPPTTEPVTPPPSPTKPLENEEDEYIATFSSCKDEESASIVKETIQRMLKDPSPPKLARFNAGLRALHHTRRPGEPLSNIIILYNAMLDASVVPDVETYETLILALTSRDFEVHYAISSLESKLNRKHLLFGRAESSIHIDVINKRLEKLKAEDNFGSAMSLFESVLAVKGINDFYPGAFAHLIRSCSFHSNVHAAIHVFAQLERRKKPIDYPVYRNMITTFSNAKMIKQAEQIFSEFLKPRKRKKSPPFDAVYTPHNNRGEQIKVWNAMIEAYFSAGMPDKAIELLERMLASTAGNKFGPNDTPIVTPSTFKVVIVGFIKSGDISSALAWFERLLAQKESVARSYDGLGGAPMRPDMDQWHEILDGLAMNGKVDDLNRLYHTMRSLADQDGLDWRAVDQLNVYSANIYNLKNLDDEAALKILDFISEDIATPSSKIYVPENLRLISALAVGYIHRGQYLTAAELTRKWYGMVYEINSSPSSQVLQEMQNDLNVITRQISITAKDGKGNLDFRATSIIVQLHTVLGLDVTYDFGPWYLHTYKLARFQGVMDYSKLTPYDWNLLLECAVKMESAALVGNEALVVVPQYAFQGAASLLEDFARQGFTFNDIDKELGRRTIEFLQRQLGDAGCHEFFSRLDPSYLEAFNHVHKAKYRALESALTQDFEPIMEIPTPKTSISEYPPLVINRRLTDMLDVILKQKGPRSVVERIEQTYALLKQNLTKGQAIDPFVLAYLIQSCGRNNDPDKVRELYAIGQEILECVLPERKLAGWVYLESSMVVAHGHLGNIETAHVHRLRILDQGCVPSADAYGILIQYVKDTTDDTSGAVALFQEALEGGIKPNLFLYNNIISKLAKARKADYALEIFRQMKVNGCPPSCITYAAVIGACTRVGDVQLAENLFSEMEAHSSPRVPAFNSMMQLFTTTKPNRTSSLYYYNKLLKTGLKPSAYTYKVYRFLFFLPLSCY